MPEFSKRAEEAEIMDDLEISGGDLDQALRELESINYLLGGNYVTLKGLAMLLEGHRDKPRLHIADLGCGSGDMLKRIRRLMERRKINAALTGIDANTNVLKHAMAHTPSTCRIEYEAMDIFSEQFKLRKFDIVTGTLFFHHFTDAQLVTFFKRLRNQVSVGLVINDIHRHWFSYYSIKILTRLLSKSPMVIHDAPVSVLRAFKRNELRRILKEAGFNRFTIKWCWAFRWQVVVWF
jgi:2-polyprenyl-3-methyl-5-hydroxy-6-metoxy-1,4-benzoquinol methylase